MFERNYLFKECRPIDYHVQWEERLIQCQNDQNQYGIQIRMCSVEREEDKKTA